MSDYDSKAIEDKAVFEVIRFFEDSKTVATFVSNNDKEPFFDGHLYLYRNGKRDNSHYIGRIAVQVKGKDLGEFNDGVFSYPIEMIDLNAYLRVGIAYFVVQEVRRKKRLYYKLLTPIELRKIITEKSGQNYVSVRLKRATDRDVKKVEIELIEFERNCRKQVSFADSKPLKFEELEMNGIHSFSFDVIGNSKKEPFYFTITKKPVFIYANINDKIQAPIGSGPANITLKRDVTEPVTIRGKVFFSHYLSTIEKGVLTINVADCLMLSFPPNELKKVVTANFKLGAKMLKDAIREAEFLLALQKEREVTICKVTISLPFPEEHPMMEGLDKQLKAWYALDNTLVKLGCNKDMDLSLIEKSNETTIDILVDMIGKGRSHSLNNVSLGLNYVLLANLNIWLFISKTPDGKHHIKSFFDKSLDIKASYQYPDGIFEESFFSWFDKKKLLECDNFPYDDVISSYENLKAVNPHAYERENLFLLELISAYDEIENGEKKDRMYAAAMKISQWLIDNDKAEYKIQNLLNRYQLLKRYPGLTDDDKKDLRSLLLDNNNNLEVSYAISLLLDDKLSYEYYWEKMNKELQEAYKKKMPIMKFHV